MLIPFSCVGSNENLGARCPLIQHTVFDYDPLSNVFADFVEVDPSRSVGRQSVD